MYVTYILFGQKNVGKTSLLNKMIQNNDQNKVISTQSCSVKNKTYQLNSSDQKNGVCEEVELKIWDTPGWDFRQPLQPQLQNIMKQIKTVKLDVIIFVYDIFDKESFNYIKEAKEILEKCLNEQQKEQEQNVKAPVMMLIANKQDLMGFTQLQRQVTFKQGQELSTLFTRMEDNTQQYAFKELTCQHKDPKYAKVKEVLEMSIRKVWDRSIKLDSYITEAHNSYTSNNKIVVDSRPESKGLSCIIDASRSNCLIF